MAFLYLKALHIIFIVTWFAGLFYIVRLFIYQVEALEKEEPERSILTKQLKMMSRRLWLIITWPSAVITLILGAVLIIVQPFFLEMDYMLIKLGLVVLLYVYHFICHSLYKKLQNDTKVLNSTKLRLWNEVATILLIGIVFLIVVKSSVSLLWGFLVLISLMVLFMVIVKWYKNYRKKYEGE